MLAVDQRRTDSYRRALGPAELYGIDAIALAHKYPIGADPLLVKILTRRAVPPGRTTFHVGVAVVDAATCWAAYRWTACGERQTARVVTVSGDHVRKRGNYLIPFGAAVEEVLSQSQAERASPAIHGSAMTGRGVVGGAVVSASSNALLAPHLPPSPPPTACIRCGWCVENCPARLNVAELNDDFELGRSARARRRGVLACLGCGTCSYVCPARLPLAHRMSLLIQAIRRRRRRAAHGQTAHSRI
jgi:electron transport complex protein RnfC